MCRIVVLPPKDVFKYSEEEELQSKAQRTGCPKVSWDEGGAKDPSLGPSPVTHTPVDQVPVPA